MRSPKQRSRSKQNRPRTLGNITNRVFDSSGPEGKVRGTPQQIIEKYQVLARDAQLSNDRVAAENFQQHAEHYTRLLAQATREMQAEADARRIAHEEQQAQQARQRQQHDDRQPRQNGQQGQNGQSQHAPRRTDGDDSADLRAPTEVFGLAQGDSDDTTLVDTPEARVQAAEPASERSAPAPRPDTREHREPRADSRAPDQQGDGRKDPRPARDGQPRRAVVRPDRPRVEGPRAEGPRAEAPRPENTRTENPRSENPRSARTRPDAAIAPENVSTATDTPDAGTTSPDAGADKPRRNTRKPRKPATGDAPADFAAPADPSRAAE